MKIAKTYTLANNVFRDYLNLLKKNDIENVLSWGYPVKSNLLLDSSLVNELNVSEKNGDEKFRYGYGYGLNEKLVHKSIVDYENMKHYCRYTSENVIICQSGSYGINRIMETLIWKMGVLGELTIIGPTFFRMLNKLAYTPGIISLNVVNGSLDKGFNLNKEELLKILDYTKIIFMCNPINPTYNFMDEEDLNYIYELCMKKGIYLVIDETGDALGTEEVSYPFSLDSQYLIRLRSLSKTYLLAESRLALIFSKNNNFLKKLKELLGDDMSNVSFSSHNAIKYIFDSELNSEYHSSYICNKKENIIKINYLKELTINYLKGIDSIIEIIKPDTCFNILFRIKSEKFDTDFDFVKYLIEKYSTSLAPGSGFGINPKEKIVRITYVVDESMLLLGLNNIKNALGE